LTRHPFSRFISAYQHLIRIGGNKLTINKFIQKLESIHAHPHQYSELFYSTFFSSLNSHQHHSQQQGHWGGARLFYPQKVFISENPSINLRSFKLETDITSLLSLINQKLNIKCSIFPHANKAQTSKNAIELDTECRELIYNMFQCDFDFYGYEAY
jgi:hypothetical protein